MCLNEKGACAKNLCVWKVCTCTHVYCVCVMCMYLCVVHVLCVACIVCVVCLCIVCVCVVYLSPPLLNTVVIVFFCGFFPPSALVWTVLLFLSEGRLEVEREDVVYQLPYID